MYDLIVIGSGPAGYTAALLAAKAGMKTLLIEKNLNNLGGTCLNEGCIPLKGLLHHSLHSADYQKIISIVTQKISGLRSGLKARLQACGVEVLEAQVKFISAGEIEAAGNKYQAKNFLISAGSAARRLFKNAKVSSPEIIFSLNPVPKRALIIGGGVIGCEYASFLNNIGVEVTIAEAAPSVLFGMDEEAVRTLVREFKKKKIKIISGAGITVSDDGGKVIIESNGVKIEEQYDIIIEATGRVPYTAGLNLEAAGIETDKKGFIKVNGDMMTNVKGIYAAGDCINTPMLAYTAYKEAETAVDNMATGKSGDLDYARIPKLVFSMPQAGSAGFLESDARKENIDYKVYKYFFKGIGKAVVEESDAGFLKLLTADDRVIGASAVGYEIADMMNEIGLIINAGVSVETIKNTMHIHPSYSEIITEALIYGETAPSISGQ
ncbi:MAG: NAD(P)/FAD-dependent oxidoreductase [Candidatus Goldbacteria bacterium]|nr:NAD(P)/FAD-dependent oxidoreductase [Candidatus Goldiibacteriota bacterium]